ncbi:MAG: hypothetical protein MJA29_02900, partial [Candidatus Omnitrophica bacterium]|nr:hypothetical protein [Candidatus Omnitrophota bacterium]
MQTITSNHAARLIRESNGHAFSVEFVKRTTGERRTMLARTGVKKGVTGAGRNYDPASHGLIGVYEVIRGNDGKFTDGQFRMVSIEGITRLTIEGGDYIV